MVKSLKVVIFTTGKTGENVTMYKTYRYKRNTIMLNFTSTKFAKNSAKLSAFAKIAENPLHLYNQIKDIVAENARANITIESILQKKCDVYASFAGRNS